MRLAYLLLIISPLTNAYCPTMLQGLSPNLTMKYDRLEEVVDTVCGRRNFTSAFWSPLFYQHTVLYMIVADEFPEDDDYVNVKPLFQSLREHFNRMDNPQAKAYIDRFSSIQRSFIHVGWPINLFSLVIHIFKNIIFNFVYSLNIDAQIAMSTTFKSAFQLVETEDMRKVRIETAMKAIERVGTLTHDEKNGELFAKLYLLVKDELTYFMSSFDQFADWIEKDWNSTAIGPMEILPAVEVLYLQYQSLNNTAAKAFVDWMLVSSAQASFRRADGLVHQSDVYEQLMRHQSANDYAMFSMICPPQNEGKCFEALSKEARTALTTAFPELFAYIEHDLDLDNWAFGYLGESNPAIEKELAEMKDREKIRELNSKPIPRPYRKIVPKGSFGQRIAKLKKTESTEEFRRFSK